MTGLLRVCDGPQSERVEIIAHVVPTLDMKPLFLKIMQIVGGGECIFADCYALLLLHCAAQVYFLRGQRLHD
jgi:hypothetical protein